VSRRNEGPYLSDDPNAHGVYEIRWTENGRSKRKSTGEADYRRAQRVYAEFILAVQGVSKAQRLTAGMVIDAYLADKTGVLAVDSQMVTFGHLRAFFGDKVVVEINKDDVAEYLQARADGRVSFTDAQGKLRGGVVAGSGTVRRELGMLLSAVNHCIAEKKFKTLDGSPLLRPGDKPAIRLPPAPPPRDHWLTRDQAKRLLAACQPDPGARLTREYRYAVMMLYTASRKEPVESLTWDRILLGQGLVDFAEPGRKVTKKRRGWVPIAAELLPILQRAYDERQGEFYLDAPRPPYHAFRRAVKRAGVKASPHVLRHTWATWAAQDGVPLYEIAGVLHDTITTVEKHYAHHCPDHLRGAVNRPMFG
jgi:integrase